MKFTWYTYAATQRVVESRFSRAFKDQFDTDALFRESSDLSQTHRMRRLLKKRMARENVAKPPTFIRDLYYFILEKRYPY